MNPMKSVVVFLFAVLLGGTAAADLSFSLEAWSGTNGFVLPYTPPPPTGGKRKKARLGAEEAARFLTQATFGPTLDEIGSLQRLGYEKWLKRQARLPAGYHRRKVEQLLDERGEKPEDDLQEARVEVWWDSVVFGRDQLRQRMAFALSEIFVVSDRNSATEDHPVGMADYYDVLVKHALGNYRDLLEDVSRHPMMGLYLSHLGNQRAWPEENIRPDENYAREVLQLFSIGLWQLNPDGTRMLDEEGNPIPTYDQDVIENFARVFTGWTWAGAPYWDWDPWDKRVKGLMKPYKRLKSWEREGGYHDRGAKRLLAYPEEGVPPSEWAREEIPALQGGEDAQTDLDRALDNIFHHPNVGPFISRQLIQRLVTSNPSPEYVARVSAVFDDNGKGVRGDLMAVARAILLDPEARKGHLKSPETFGKLREPIIRQAHLWRALDGHPKKGNYVEDAYPEYFHGQAPLRAPSVFNFFRPDYSPPGEVSDAGLVAPEFQITNETYITRSANGIFYLLIGGYPGSPYGSGEMMELDLDREARLAKEPRKLIDHLDLLFLSGQMSDATRGILLELLPQVPMRNDWLEGTRRKGILRALTAIYLVLVSPDYAIQR